MGGITEKKLQQGSINQNCIYCSHLLGNNESGIWDTILFESENFVVTPTKGSIVEGWLLIIPKEHVLNFSMLSKSLFHELGYLREKVKSYLSREFGPVTEFEHGPSRHGDLLGCGINHAHLHLVSLSFDLFEAIQAYSEYSYKWEIVSDLEKLKYVDFSQNGYLYFSTPNSVTRYARANTSVSQYFRRIIADKLELKDYFDYKKYSFSENVISTVNKLSKFSTPIFTKSCREVA